MRSVGQIGDYRWETVLREDAGRVCLHAEVEPGIRSIEGPSDDLDRFLEEELWSPPSCTPPLEASGPQFGLVFVPYVYQGEQFDRPVIIGLVVDGVVKVELVYLDGSAEEVAVEPNDTFVAFPDHLVVELRMKIDGRQFRCPVRQLRGRGQAFDHCAAE